ncbi:unnamed protein product [Echinostoma caproni]|uniref:WD_REPEATS_REGION domain-containing protein n=1 Tax=Echinostoma caproni TaxID=27848 RepID=A0A3P8JAC9_9TREM|nr:unnamed protein product [Echinostoma caproni]
MSYWDLTSNSLRRYVHHGTMLRFGRKCSSQEESEFEIVRSCESSKDLEKQVDIEQESRVQQSPSEKRSTSDTTLKPAWNDEDDAVVIEDYRPIPVLDVRSKKRKQEVEGASDAEDSDAEFGVHCTRKILRDEASPFLPETKTIGIRRVFDANRERISLGPLSSVDFNPVFQMLLTASEDSTLAMFKIYDLQTGSETRASPFIGSTPDQILSNCQVSPGQPNLVSLQNGANKVYMADLRSLERISTLHARGPIRSTCFLKDGTFFYTLDSSGLVYVFDLRMKNPVMAYQWTDEASTGGAAIASSPDGHWIACGSDSGFVNVYPAAKVSQSPHPHPDKSIANLRTRVDLAVFHPGNEMLCIGSSDHSAAVRLYHMRSRQVFDNFPVRVGRLDLVSSIAFSPGGKYLCIGQKNGRAALYSISHYPDY